MTGVWVHAALLAVAAVRAARGSPGVPVSRQRSWQMFLGFGVLYAGVTLVGLHLGNGPAAVLRQLAIGMAALVAGNVVGRLLRLQTLSNRVGRDAARLWGHSAAAGGTGRAWDLFRLLAVSPLAWLGCAAQGLGADWRPLVLKGVIESLSLLGLPAPAVRHLPLVLLGVAVWQGSLVTALAYLVPWMERRALLEPALVQTGLLLMTAVPVVLGVRKVPLANYLPALVIGPALAAWWR